MPTTPTTSPYRAIAKLLVLATVLVAVSGCVYLRLLRFKGHLKEFEQYVQVDRSHGLALIFLEPALRDEDFIFITESEPTLKQALPGSPSGEVWHWVFEKELPAESGAEPFDILFRTTFEDHLLTRIDFDPELLSAIPKDFIVELFKSMGKARINKLRRSATAKMSRDALVDVPLPSLKEIESVMGDPSERETKGKRSLWRYEFNFHNPENRELSGQFRIVFKSDSRDLDQQITGFEVSGKGR
ncbi:hypothetical protein [Pelagicoccus sp. SDUM812003]|uniref:hypothetical protein n=1 Tax=Pelagicoccus sp. SDUM812003 TaxID=3041267 RepID=UPI00280EB7DC|nr:hypothetical protein [Pelagicoccus sp. SDUM812003]MDQ8203926.1 hypothetical protein [Pelagicoccus sp. SDUM812003]